MMSGKSQVASKAQSAGVPKSVYPLSLEEMDDRRWTDSTMRKRVDKQTYEMFHRSISTGEHMPKANGNILADAMMRWAMERGATKFSHVFYPLRAATGMHNSGEKLTTFLDFDYGSKSLLKEFQPGGFTYSDLNTTETDGSSFPSGGLRKTPRAAAFNGWDKTSPPFVRNSTLYLPSTLMSFTGHSLDEKLPLLRSMEAVNKQGLRLVRALGDLETTQVVPNVGTEQEYFIIDDKDFFARPDLQATGRTVLGADPSRGQQTDQHYFATYSARVREFMEDVEAELWALGVSLVVQHNEVAPLQHEFSPVFALTNVSADQNILCIEVMNEIAVKHGLRVLFHEKPFANVNGSGKHCNWGLNTDTGRNLFVPGKTPESQASFTAFVAAVVRALHLHGDLIRTGVACTGNDHRLGAQEAPPAIVSVYTGDGMMAHLEAVMAGGELAGYAGGTQQVGAGSKAVGAVTCNNEDRNRTAPFPFCGNRFEFRAVGSSQNISAPMTYVNTAMAESMGALADLIEGGMSPRDATAKVLTEHKAVIFNGNGYSEEWVAEAAARGLPNLKTCVDAFRVLDSEKNKALMQSQNVLSPEECTARREVGLESYVNTRTIEANTMVSMLNSGVIPACAADLAGYVAAPELAGTRKDTYTSLAKETAKLVEAIAAIPSEVEEACDYIQATLLPQMTATRALHDTAETLIASKLYPFPTYHDIFYNRVF